MKDLEVRDPVPPTKRVHKLVLTGGPCGGKTTGQAHLATFFESLGWKVFRVPETATVLMSGGISFGELNEEQVVQQTLPYKLSLSVGSLLSSFINFIPRLPTDHIII